MTSETFPGYFITHLHATLSQMDVVYHYDTIRLVYRIKTNPLHLHYMMIRPYWKM